jgi:hypothetical protein
MNNNRRRKFAIVFSHCEPDVQNPGRQPTSTTNTLYIDRHCHKHGLLEQWIETTSEVVSILIG